MALYINLWTVKLKKFSISGMNLILIIKYIVNNEIAIYTIKHALNDILIMLLKCIIKLIFSITKNILSIQSYPLNFVFTSNTRSPYRKNTRWCLILHAFPMIMMVGICHTWAVTPTNSTLHAQQLAPLSPSQRSSSAWSPSPCKGPAGGLSVQYNR